MQNGKKSDKKGVTFCHIIKLIRIFLNFSGCKIGKNEKSVADFSFFSFYLI